MVAQTIKVVKTPEAEKFQADEQQLQIRNIGQVGRVVVKLTRREQIIASIPPAADLDLIVIDPPKEWD